MRIWAELTPDKQLQLRLDYQAELDRAPRTCNLDEKLSRFADWLADRDIAFTADDLSRK